jgi:hypothetical protein
MLERLFNQYDQAWSGHALGSGAGELGPYGCREVCDTMVAYDAFGDMHYNPASFDDLMYSRGQFGGDLLNVYALDHVWPDRFKTVTYDGMRLDVARTLVSSYSKVDYIRLWLSGVYSPLWKMTIGTHFVLLLRADGWIADPAGGVVRSINDYGGWAAVKAMAHVHCTPLAQPIVVAPVPEPIPTPPAPAPTFSVVIGSVILVTGLSYEAALERALIAATVRPGSLYEVLDAAGKVVGTGFVAPLPGPIEPPVTPLPTPAPPKVQQPDFWALLQDFLIRILAPMFASRRQFSRK